jgi:hypothetical protein
MIFTIKLSGLGAAGRREYKIKILSKPSGHMIVPVMLTTLKFT